MWQEGLVASRLWAGVSLALGSGRVGVWEECSEEDLKDGNNGSRWLMGRVCGTACLGRQNQVVSKLGLTLLIFREK